MSSLSSLLLDSENSLSCSDTLDLSKAYIPVITGGHHFHDIRFVLRFPLFSLHSSFHFPCRLSFTNITHGFKFVTLKIVFRGSSWTAAVLFSTDIYVKMPSHRLGFIMNTNKGVPAGRSRSLWDIFIALVPTDCMSHCTFNPPLVLFCSHYPSRVLYGGLSV